jgi:hypothetical protein
MVVAFVFMVCVLGTSEDLAKVPGTTLERGKVHTYQRYVWLCLVYPPITPWYPPPPFGIRLRYDFILGSNLLSDRNSLKELGLLTEGHFLSERFRPTYFRFSLNADVIDGMSEELEQLLSAQLLWNPWCRLGLAAST